ncbi:hypothetical protein ACHQM5_021998 [Ranunculus cassubicifolius]
MGKILVEICLISARGLRCSSSLWKLHWYAVGWVDPKNKYCTRVDTSGGTNPCWRTKFPVSLDLDDKSNWESLELHVQVYSRDAIFLRERLQGTAVVLLKEFLTTTNREEGSRSEEQVGSFQLRKKHNNSGKQAQGFIDVSIRISGSEDDHGIFSPHSYPASVANNNGGEGFFQLNMGQDNNRIPYSASQPPPPYSSHPDMIPSGHAEIYQPQPQMGSASTYDQHPSMQQYPANNYYTRPQQPQGGGAVGAGASYQPPRTPPPPPPPSHVGYIPTFFPSAGQLPGTYVNIPSSSTGGGRAGGQNFGMGMGAGALAAGAVLFGDDFMSEFQIPSSLQDDALF